MDTGIFKKLIANKPKVKWAKEGIFNAGKPDETKVEVLDVDLKAGMGAGEAFYSILQGRIEPMAAVVRFRNSDGSEHEIKGTFWPRDLKPERVIVDGVQMAMGKTGLAGKAKPFPPRVKLRLRFTFIPNTDDAVRTFEVPGQIKALPMVLDLLKVKLPEL